MSTRTWTWHAGLQFEELIGPGHLAGRLGCGHVPQLTAPAAILAFARAAIIL
ncbi:MAG: hypothetical protein IT424_14345 [Pirellulales bacterium]|nr:hypothetical protein [Pirellulales bacterium]